MITAPNEASTWAIALTGDTRAFAYLFDLHYDRVFRHIVGLTDQTSDADEVAGATFFELWRKRNEVRVVNGSVLPWLLVTAGNLARNHGRKAARYRAVLAKLPRDATPVDPTAVVEDDEELRRRSALVREALRGLSPLDSQLLALTLTTDISTADAAAALGIQATAARVRLHRLRKRLHAQLSPLLATQN